MLPESRDVCVPAGLVSVLDRIACKEHRTLTKKETLVAPFLTVDCTAGRFAAGSSSDGVERLFLPSIEDKIFQSKISNVTSMRTEAK